MKEIKTRETVRDIRILDRTGNLAARMKNDYIRKKEETEQTDANSPEEYAVDCAAEKTQDIAHTMGNVLRNQGKYVASKVKTLSDFDRTNTSESRHSVDTVRGRGFMHTSAQRHDPVDGVKKTTERYPAPPKSAVKNRTYVAKTNEKLIRKNAVGRVKTAERTSREAAKAAQAMAKTAAKTAQTAAETAKKVQETAKIAAASMKTAAKTAAAAAKAIAAAIKELIAAVAAGGWAAAVVIIVVLLAGYVLGSVFGIFASEEGYGGAPSMPETVSEINAEFSDKINAIIASIPHDSVVISNAGSAAMAANWDDVLAVYAVLVSTDSNNSTEVATLDDEKIEKLKTVFWDMNRINYSVNTVQIGADSATGKPVSKTILTITVCGLSAEDMILIYGLSAERVSQLRELLQPKYAELFQRLIGSYKDITLSAQEIEAIMEMLPDDLSEKRKEVVLTAYSLLGKVQYFWGGKSLVLGWDSRWGIPTTVTSEGSRTTGTVRPFGVDCSGFVDWVFYNAYNGEYIIGHGGGTSSQYTYCDPIAWNNAQPGDLVFYPNCEHIGIVVENDAGTLTVIHCASGYNNVVMTKNTQGSSFAFAGRPKIYYE